MAGEWLEGGSLKFADHQTVLGTLESVPSVNCHAGAFLPLPVTGLQPHDHQIVHGWSLTIVKKKVS